MRKMLQFKRYNSGTFIYISVDHIISITAYGTDGTSIRLSTDGRDGITVADTPDVNLPRIEACYEEDGA